MSLNQAEHASTTFGGYSEKVTPVPIPNTVVKLLSAENTWRATAREHKSPPELFIPPELFLRGLFCYSIIPHAIFSPELPDG